MTTDVGVLLPVRIETRFKKGDLWLRVIPDDLWFIRSDERVTPTDAASDFAGFEVKAHDGADLREAIGQRLYQNGWPLRRLDLRQTTLEDRFVQAVTRGALASGQPEREAV